MSECLKPKGALSTMISLYTTPIHPLVTVDEMVEALAVQNNLNAASQTKILNLARKAILSGELNSRDPQTTARITDLSKATPLVIPQDFNTWVANTGMTLKLPAINPKRVRVKKPAVQTNNWKMRIQTQATSQFLALRKGGANPTVHSIINDIHAWCVQNNDQQYKSVSPVKTGFSALINHQTWCSQPCCWKTKPPVRYIL
jgi:hypothetical protein